MRNKNCAFSLMELIIVLLIISILSSVGYVFYGDHLIRVRRTCATAALKEIAGKLEQYYALNNSYAAATLENLHVNDSYYKKYYKITMHLSAQTYNLCADPIATQKQDTLCGALFIDELGNESSVGNVAECWN
jgi:type IV pilus assembly protein PilE